MTTTLLTLRVLPVIVLASPVVIIIIIAVNIVMIIIAVGVVVIFIAVFVVIISTILVIIVIIIGLKICDAPKLTSICLKELKSNANNFREIMSLEISRQR